MGAPGPDNLSLSPRTGSPLTLGVYASFIVVAVTSVSTFIHL